MGERLNLYFPLWIDGGLGPELAAGARALRDYLAPGLAFEELPEEGACDPGRERGITGYRDIVRALGRARELLLSRRPERILAIGGGCGIEVAVVGYLLGRHPGLKALWLDAHGDLNSPATSPSSYFHGMPVRFLLEPALDAGIRPGGPALEPACLRYVGTRDLDPPEAARIEELGIEVFPAGRALEAARGWEGSPVYLHLDLDALDPAEYPNVKCPSPGGLSVAEVACLVGALRDAGSLVGLSVVENVATDPADIRRLEPILAAARAI